MHRARTVLVMLAATLALSAPAVPAADRALLVGIGHYGRMSPLPPLPGIDIDLAKMQQVVDIMGFAPSNVRVLKDQGATAKSIREAISNWLIAGTQPGDRALLYFSGHGSQVRDRLPRDESDGMDEVLVGYDVRLDLVDGQLRASGVLTDDLFDLLGHLADRNVLILLDACSSGSATRGGGTPAVASSRALKAANLEGIPPGQSIRDGWSDPNRTQRWTTLAAADDAESAIATPYGSLFTQAVHEEVLEKRASRSTVSLTEFRNEVAAYLSNWATAVAPVSEPVLAGPSPLGSKGIRLVQPDARGPVRRQVESLENRPGTNLFLSPRRDYRLGDVIRLDVVPRDAGYLNVIAVDSDDRAYVLFPNCYQPNNRVKAGARYSLGDSRTMGFSLTADQPMGETYVIAIFTGVDQPINFYHEALSEYGVDRSTSCEAPNADSAIWRLSTHAVLRAKGIRVTAPVDSYLAHGLTINVRETRESVP